MEIDNFFKGIPGTLHREWITPLFDGPHGTVERIVSRGHCSPPGFWYVQDTIEWVMVLQGRARLHFEAPEAETDLNPGDFVTIPAGRRHRVAWTDPDQNTIWIAVHFKPPAQAP